MIAVHRGDVGAPVVRAVVYCGKRGDDHCVEVDVFATAATSTLASRRCRAPHQLCGRASNGGAQHRDTHVLPTAPGVDLGGNDAERGTDDVEFDLALPLIVSHRCARDLAAVDLDRGGLQVRVRVEEVAVARRDVVEARAEPYTADATAPAEARLDPLPLAGALDVVVPRRLATAVESVGGRLMVIAS